MGNRNAVVLAFALLVFASPAIAADNGCLDCHEQSGTSGKAARAHQDFAGSVHSRAGIGCDACHGGDAAAREKQAAHAGIKPSKSADSPIYFKNVPATCGSCHKAQFSAFSKSRHGQALKTSGKGPNCVTCHGSMATRILTTDQFETACLACHNERMGGDPDKPRLAAAVLSMTRQAATLTDWAEAFVRIAKQAGQDTKKASRDVKAARRSLAAAHTAWHTFDMQRVREHTQAAARSAVQARDRLAP